MTTIITPKAGRRDDETDPIGKLAATLLSVTVAGMADTARFRRGKAYVTDGAVTRLEIRPGLLLATVLGSRADPYSATIAVDLAERPEGLGDTLRREDVKNLCPQPGDLVTSCTCPDWEDPCKHAVAGLLSLANEISKNPDLLVEWRCTAGSTAPRATIGSRAKGERHLHLVSLADKPVNPFDNDEWRAFEGVGLPAPDLEQLSTAPVAIGPMVLDTIDVGRIIRSALASLSDDDTDDDTDHDDFDHQ